MEPQDFKSLIYPFKDKLFRVALVLLKDRQRAEDAVQDVLLKLWTMRLALRSYNKMEALAVTMIKNICFNMLKKYKREQVEEDSRIVEMQSLLLSPYEISELKDKHKLMHALIEKLPFQQKLILHLRNVEGYSFEEIEEVTGLTANNIRVILSRTRQQIKKDFKEIIDYEFK